MGILKRFVYVENDALNSVKVRYKFNLVIDIDLLSSLVELTFIVQILDSPPKIFVIELINILMSLKNIYILDGKMNIKP